MAVTYEIRILVQYDEAYSIPDMETELRENVKSCVECSELLNDINLEAVVEDWNVEVNKLF